MNHSLKFQALVSIALAIALAGCVTQERKNKVAVEKFKQASSGQWRSASGADAS